MYPPPDPGFFATSIDFDTSVALLDRQRANALVWEL
jgi:hypothetical protein